MGRKDSPGEVTRQPNQKRAEPEIGREQTREKPGILFPVFRDFSRAPVRISINWRGVILALAKYRPLECVRGSPEGKEHDGNVYRGSDGCSERRDMGNLRASPCGS